MRLSAKTVLFLIVTVAAPEAFAGLQSALRSYYWANPVANYNPRTGNVTLTGLATLAPETLNLLRRFEIQSSEVPLLIGAAQIPSGGIVELLTTPDGIAWSAAVFQRPFNAGDVVPPNTPVNTLAFRYGIDFGVFSSVEGAINLVPEPSAFALAASSLLGISAIRRRFAA